MGVRAQRGAHERGDDEHPGDAEQDPLQRRRGRASPRGAPRPRRPLRLPLLPHHPPRRRRRRHRRPLRPVQLLLLRRRPLCQKVAETARKLGIMVIADEVYDHLAFGSNPFVPMGVFGEIVPVITLGSISKRWVVPGWRLGWIATSDPKGILRETKGAIPHILENTKDDFFDKIIAILRETADICYDTIKEIDCITCPHKPEGSMFMMVKFGGHS